MLCPKCGNPVEEGDRFCLNCGAPVAESAPEPQQVAPATSLQPQPKMGWFKFLIYFSLFAAAVLNVVNAIQLLTGSHYGNSDAAKLVYMVFPDMKGIDMITGFCMIAMAAVALIARFRLAGFHKNGPTLLYIVYAGNTIINLIYYFAAGSIVSFEVLTKASSNVITNAVVSIVMIIINVTYFGKRKHLFVNP
jgi:hypothetical protein